MGLISGILGLLFGSGRNVVRETAEVFRESAESGAERAMILRQTAMDQFGAEFHAPVKGGFDRFMDGVNRLPRPALALGTLGLFVAAMIDPVWFAVRMQGVALVPEPLWWLLGVVVSFYFGSRHQVKTQEFQREISASLRYVPEVMANLETLGALASDRPGAAEAPQSGGTARPEENRALEDWRRLRNT